MFMGFCGGSWRLGEVILSRGAAHDSSRILAAIL
jgi:hypothetical protein